MSYAIVKAIKIDEVKKEVWIKSDSSNVYPKIYTWWHCVSLSKILAENGLVEVQKEILLQYYNGNFQRTDNNYEKSLILLDRDKFYWGRDVAEEKIKKVLYENYITFCNRKKSNFIIFNKIREYYVSKFYKNGCYLVPDKADAKIFKSKEEALLKLRYFEQSKYEVLEVA